MTDRGSSLESKLKVNRASRWTEGKTNSSDKYIGVTRNPNRSKYISKTPND